jgi:hypothetical protein
VTAISTMAAVAGVRRRPQPHAAAGVAPVPAA